MRVLTKLPALGSLLALAGVSVFGFSTGWSAPKFRELFGARATAPVEDWCPTHNVTQSRCVACNPSLAGENAADWCKEHGVPESRCTICHPEILTTGVAGDWCKEHGLPESGCTLCHPEIARIDERAPVPGDVTVARGTAQDRDPSTCQKHLMKVQFASPAAVAKTGLAFAPVVSRPMTDVVVATATIDYDRTRYARVASRVAGTAVHVGKNAGDPVRAGDVLAKIESPEVARAQSEYLAARAALEVAERALERLSASAEAGFRTANERLEADARRIEAAGRVATASTALTSLRVAMPNDAAATALVSLEAPLDGTIVARDLVLGDPVEPATLLFAIADLTRLWIVLDVAERDASRVALGQTVVFRADGAPDEAQKGVVTWMASEVGARTRTVRVRADLEVPAGSLRANTFGVARVVVRRTAEAIAVPNAALQWEGCCHVVFVRMTDELFETRKVRLGARDDEFTEIVAGVLPGETVVTTGSHVLKSEINKSLLGAGCCDDR
ncbi:MAG: efflux RND transporter periplasmic adaptor subunit [Planctomycetes bacterium]|nr:efflux RND transporter periplasmic adaptor subunit [Planctomycetota bacterium]